jgi:hypothetical protein
LDDFHVGQHVMGTGSEGPGDLSYSGTVMALQKRDPAQGFIKVKLDQPNASGLAEVPLNPHEITASDEPQTPEEKPSW